MNMNLTNPKCDCCLSHWDRLWVYPHRGFGTRLSDIPIDFEAGWWAMCVHCHALFIREEYDLLAARVLTLHPEISVIDAEWLYQLVAQVINGDVVEWQEGQPFDERFSAPQEIEC